VVAALARLCHDLGARVVAEGVEHEAQLAALSPLGVSLVQGYYFGRPSTPPPPPKHV
jgi:EAL domain-containing protein (putative c-di-GMP-specific phosphodiesterase class I)